MAASGTPIHDTEGTPGVPEHDGHASIHDDETARKLGPEGGTIEGPTHFSQLAPIAL